MTPLKKLQSQIRRKTKELLGLESKRLEMDFQISEARGAISALEEAMKHFPKEDVDGDPARSLRTGSTVHKIYEILKKHGEPMRIEPILEAMGRSTDAKSQQATASQLNSYIRNERIFWRPAGNTFALREWNVSGNNSPTNSEDAQPALALADEGEAVNPN